MIKRIRIQGYKSLKDVDLCLKPLSVIFGPNAAGKSNLLDSIYLISRLGTCKTLTEAFEGHRGFPLESFYYGDKGFEKLILDDRVTATFEVDIELSDRIRQSIEEIIREKRRGLDDVRKKTKIEKYVRYRISIEIIPKTGILRIVDEFFTALKPSLDPKKRTPFIERDPESGKRLHLRLEGQAHPRYFEIGLDHTIVSTPLYEPHYPHIAALKKELENWRVYYFEPREIMRATVPVAEVERIGARGENLPSFLNTLQHRFPQEFEDLQLSLRSVLPTLNGVSVERTPDGLLSLRIREDGLSYPARLISEGILRVLGLLAAVHPSTETTVIGYEEPENGVHPTRLEVIAQLLKTASTNSGKQIIINTHSPYLPGFFSDDELFVCQKDNGYTTVTPFTTVGPLYKEGDIRRGLEERIVRGDFGG